MASSETGTEGLAVEKPLGVGRELDGLIAERVMGFAWKRAPIRDRALKGLVAPGDFPAWDELHGDEEPARDWYRFAPHYSTEIAAAWQVVGRLCAESAGDFNLEYHGDCGRDTDAAHVAWYAEFTIRQEYFDAFGETAPLAICRAALAAQSPSEG